MQVIWAQYILIKLSMAWGSIVQMLGSSVLNFRQLIVYLEEDAECAESKYAEIRGSILHSMFL